MRLYTRIISLILALSLVAGYLPQTAWAQAVHEEETVTEEVLDLEIPNMEVLEDEEIVLPPVTDTPANAVNSGTIGDNISWRVSTGNEILYISGTGPVTEAPWRGRNDIKKAIIYDGITSLPEHCFDSVVFLREVSFPKTLTEIPSFCFWDTNLQDMVLPDTITSIGSYAFYKSTLKSIVIPDSVTDIGEGAFRFCFYLQSARLPAVIDKIPDELFDNCSSLTSVILPERCTSIGKEAFLKCERLTDVVFPDGLTRIGDNAFQSCRQLTNIELPDSLTEMGTGIFKDCSGILSARLPEGLGRIEDGTFAGCLSLAECNIPSGVTSIGNEAFRSCNLVEAKIPSGVTSIGNSAFGGCNLVELELPAGLRTIGKSAFWYNDFSSVKIPKGVTRIEADTFHGCGNLTDISLPSGLTYIGRQAFRESGLKSITIPSGVTQIGEGAFQDCAALGSITIPGGVTRIEASAFANCSALGSITIPSGVTRIEASAFVNCTALGSVTIPGAVTYIGESAFENSGLRTVVIPDKVTTIGASAFANCTALVSAKLPLRLNNIADKLFNYCTSLEEVIIPDGARSIAGIGTQAFKKCTRLRDVTIPDGVTTIGFEAFRNCGVQSITIPDSVKTIDEQAFASCINLVNARLPAGLTRIEYGLFFECQKLESVVFPDKLVTIGEYAFYYCKQLRDPVLPEGVTLIEKYAFYNTTSLSSIVIPATVTEIKYSAFGAAGLQHVYYGGTTTQWQNITLGTYNYGLTDASIHLNGQDRPILSGELSLVCYVNLRDADDKEESYVLASGVTATMGSKSYKSNWQGQMSITTKENEMITFSKKGYVSRSYTVEQLMKDNKVYLQKEYEGPVIYALWSDGVDVLHDPLYTRPDSPDVYPLKPDILWGEHGMGTLKLYQEGKQVALVDGDNSVAIAQKFDITKEIRIVAVDGEGNKAEKALEIANLNVKKMDGFSFKMGDKLSITLPESAGILAGKKIEFGLFSPLAVDVIEDNGRFYGAIGFVSGTTTEHNKAKEIKSFSNNAKELRDALSDAKTQMQKYRLARQAIAMEKENIYPISGSWGFDTTASVMGFVEGYIDANGDPVVTDGGVTLLCGAEWEGSQNFLLAGFPMVFELGFGADLQTQMKLYMDSKIKILTPSFELKTTIKVSGGIGPGVSKVLSLTFGGKGILDWIIQTEKAQVTYSSLVGRLEWYIKLKLAFATFEDGDKFAERTFYEYPDPGASVMLMDLDEEPEEYVGMPDYYDISEYTIDDLSYLSYGSPFMGGVTTFSLRQQNMDGPFVANAYEGADPQVAFFSDGTRIAVWIGYNEEYAGADGLNLYYSYYNGIWSEPQVVENDGTVDTYPDLKVVDDVAYLVWQDASGSVNGYGNIGDVAGLMDISGAVFDAENGCFNSFAVTENSGVLNLQPKLCGEGDSVYVVWQRNGQNDWFGQNYANSLLCSSFDGTGWSGESALYSGLGPVVDFDVTYADGVRVAYSMDGDCDLSTQEDMEVYINGSTITNNNALDSGVTYNGTDVYWYSGGKLVCNGYTVLPEGVTIGSDRFQVLNENGVCAVIYVGENELASTLNAVYYDDAIGGWGSPVVIYNAGTNIADFSSSVTPEGEISILIQNQEVVGDYGDEDPYGMVSLDWYNAPLGCNLCLDDIYYSNENYAVNQEMPVHLVVSNTGELTISQILVEWLDETGKTVYQQTVDAQLLSGETQEIQTSYKVTNLVQGKKLTVRVTPVGLDETDLEDNTAEMILSWNDIALENPSYGKIQDGSFIIYTSVVNRGYDVERDVVVNLLEGAADGPVVDSVTLEYLDPSALRTVSFELPLPTQNAYYIKLVHKENDGDFSNNSAFLLLEHKDFPVCTGERHEFGEPTFEWTEDMECNLQFVCENCDLVRSLSCAVTGAEYPETDPEGERSEYTATLEVNGQTYTDTKIKRPHQHTAGETWSSDENFHWKTCADCGEPMEPTAHSSANETCGKQAVCQVCQMPYGDPDGHDYEDSWAIGNAEGHWHNCRNCDAHDVPVPHDLIRDETTPGVEICRECGYRIHSCVATDTWYFNEEYHWRVCRICSVKMDQEGHCVGTESGDSTVVICTVCDMVFRDLESLEWAHEASENSSFWATAYYQKIMENYAVNANGN